MQARHMVPILNVSDLPSTFDWFARLGWQKAWDWCPAGSTSATFGAVSSGHFEIFVCRDGQGGRGRDGGIGGDGQGVWLSIWVDDVDAVYAECQRAAIEVLREPQDEPWGVRELLIRHPDGHVFRIGTSLEADDHEHGHEHNHDHEHPHTH
jgi:hypothetical protein